MFPNTPFQMGANTASTPREENKDTEMLHSFSPSHAVTKSQSGFNPGVLSCGLMKDLFPWNGHGGRGEKCGCEDGGGDGGGGDDGGDDGDG